MSVTISQNQEKRELTLKITGRFDFGLHQDFRRALDWPKDTVKKVIVDFRQTEYMDSSALGMLLTLREKLNNEKNAVILKNPGTEIKKILEIANFDKLFKLE